VIDLGGPLDFTAVLDAAVTDANGGAAVVAMGNIHGQGEVLLERMRSLPAAARTMQRQGPPTHPITIMPGHRDRPSRSGNGHDQQRVSADTQPLSMTLANPHPSAAGSARRHHPRGR